MEIHNHHDFIDEFHDDSLEIIMIPMMEFHDDCKKSMMISGNHHEIHDGYFINHR